MAKSFIPGLRVINSISKPLTIYYDNKATIFFSHNNKSSDASKHINLRYLIVRERVHDRTINLEHIGTKEMLADPLTKGLPPHIFLGTCCRHEINGEPLILDVPNKATNSYYE
jgi:hypothetical protein